VLLITRLALARRPAGPPAPAPAAVVPSSPPPAAAPTPLPPAEDDVDDSGRDSPGDAD
jgi:hypothetical protein